MFDGAIKGTISIAYKRSLITNHPRPPAWWGGQYSRWRSLWIHRHNKCLHSKVPMPIESYFEVYYDWIGCESAAIHGPSYLSNIVSVSTAVHISYHRNEYPTAVYCWRTSSNIERRDPGARILYCKFCSWAFYRSKTSAIYSMWVVFCGVFLVRGRAHVLFCLLGLRTCGGCYWLLVRVGS